MASIGLRDLLLKITDSSNIGTGEFIFKEVGTRTIQQTLMTLAVAHLHEIPVYITRSTNYQVFGLWDLLPSIIQTLEDGRDELPSSPPSESQLYKIKTSFHSKLRSTVASALEETPSLHTFVSFESANTLYEVVESMLEHNHTQISVVTENKVLLNVITVELLMRFIYTRRMRMHKWQFTMTVGELNLGGGEPLCTILESDPAVEAFKLMHIKKVPCVAVVDSRKRVVGCINLSDLQVIFKPRRSIADLSLPASQFIELGLLLSKGVIPAPFATCATCNKDSTIGELLAHAVRNRAWNFFFLESDDTASRLITSRDIIAALFSIQPTRSPPLPLLIAAQLLKGAA